MPFYVATRMTQYSSTLSNPSVFIPTASTYARHALRTLGWSDRTTGYWPHTIQVSTGVIQVNIGVIQVNTPPTPDTHCTHWAGQIEPQATGRILYRYVQVSYR